MKVIILAGGTGTRLWPMSRDNNPKQFNAITSQKVMLRETFDRLQKGFDIKDIYVSTGKKFSKRILEIIKELPEENLIIEPEKRDTGPAMGFVAAYLSEEFPDEPIIFAPSDHYIQNEDLYIKCFKTAEKIVRDTGKMLDIAIKPTFPDVNLGYTHIGKLYKEIDGVKVYEFKGHKEKPEYEVAKKYLEDGNYLWHANYYTWTPKAFLEAYKKYAPEIYRHLEKIKKAFKLVSGEERKVIKEEYSKMEKISIDYAITEKMDPSDVLIIAGDFGWSDVGMWSVLKDKLSKSKDANVVKANNIDVNSKNCLIYGREDKIIATCGLKDIIVVDTDDALLVCSKDKAQDVKKIVERLKEEKKDKYL